MTTLIYDNSFDGFLSAVFAAFPPAAGCTIAPARSQHNTTLFDARELETDEAAAERVRTGVLRFGNAFLRDLYTAFLSELPEVENHLLRVIRLAFRLGRNPLPLRHDPSVSQVCAALDKTVQEAERMRQFVRFSVTEAGFYVADITPEHNVLELIVPHFSSRFRGQRMIIRDLGRNLALAIDGQRHEIFELQDSPAPFGQEDAASTLWRDYFNTMAIEWRINPKLQRSFVPMRYRKHMPEFR